MQKVCYIGINSYLCSVIKIKKLINKKLSKMKKTNKEIKQLFENMNVQPMFEINLAEYIDHIDDEYTYCYINYDENTNMLQYGGITNCGFYCEYEFEYDKYFSIDQNLEYLLEMFIENSINEYQNEN